MSETLQKRLKMSRFDNAAHKALLSILVAASQMRAQTDRATSEFGISSEQYNILRILRGNPDGHACGAIAERMVDRSPDITRRIDSLERQGLVERARSMEDRRVVITKITPKGLELVDRMKEVLQFQTQNVASKLTEEECEELTRLCAKLIDDEICKSLRPEQTV